MQINFENATQLQILKGFGTSSCWWSQNVSDKNTAEDIANLLYTKDGLDLNIYRYNIGGGYDKNNFRVTVPWRKTESLYTFDAEKETGGYDFTLDKNARDFMKLCFSLGNIDTVILFANSPHWSHTSSGQASGSLLYHTCNIPKSNYHKFVDYILTITEFFINDGIPVKYISPINEPQWKWGGSYVWQDGCHYETEELVEIYRMFSKEIDKRNIPVKLYAPESGEMGGLTKEYFDALTGDREIMKNLGVFAYHSYHADNSPEARIEFKENIVKNSKNLRVDMSEWCELPCKSHAKSIKSTQIIARVIGQDLILGGAESWTGWVAVNQTSIKEDGFDYTDGLISANVDFSKWYIAKRYYGLAHFSKFIPKGSVCLDIGFLPDSKNDFNVFAFKTPENSTVLVAVNEKGKSEELSLNGCFKSEAVYITDCERNLEETYSGDFTGAVTVPSDSVMTVVLK